MAITQITQMDLPGSPELVDMIDGIVLRISDVLGGVRVPRAFAIHQAIQTMHTDLNDISLQTWCALADRYADYRSDTTRIPVKLTETDRNRLDSIRSFVLANPNVLRVVKTAYGSDGVGVRMIAALAVIYQATHEEKWEPQ